MKIGILTFHYCKNYGAYLQAFALKSYMENLGNDVFFVNYKINSLLRRYNLFPYYKEKRLISNIKFNVYAIFKIKSRLLRINRFNLFAKKYFKEKDIKAKADADLIIIGSDQVWNPKLTYGYDEVYYGILAEKYKIPHCTYAVSCPASLFKLDIKKYLSNFIRLGVREEELQLKLTDLFHINSYINIDPTLLFTDTFYLKLIKNRDVLKQKYLLSYNLMFNADLSEYSKTFATEQDLLCVDMQSNVFRTAGPIEFLSLIKNAEYVVSSSFHGTVFSILFHKKFMCFLSGDERDERIKSLLKSLGLEQCIYSKTNVCFPVIDWNSVDENLERMRKESKQYITDIFKTLHKY